MIRLFSFSIKTKDFIYLLYPLIMILILVECNPQKKNTSNNSEKLKKKTEQVNNPESFDAFYERFHSDSTFQLSRIRFPLKGERIEGDTIKKWKKEDWNLMKTTIYEIDTAQYRVDYQKTEDTFVQKLWINNSGFKSVYRFKRIDGKWYLVYASEQNL